MGQVLKLPGTKGFCVGCRVRVNKSATHYATGQKIASFVKASMPKGVGGASRAMGVDRVPYDNYPIMAHEGEKLLTKGYFERAISVRADSPIFFLSKFQEISGYYSNNK